MHQPAARVASPFRARNAHLNGNQALSLVFFYFSMGDLWESESAVSLRDDRAHLNKRGFSICVVRRIKWNGPFLDRPLGNFRFFVEKERVRG